ncbi:MAG: Asp-tRNA(Asn)/Glu-tRNA(Gln) amidotransferase subunit GatC [Deltaproteobacteria bacterium]|nr:Asp-tRNA(Asn)/Glu-tRNA(Gln) amidotransferase subunit GatC [Deltaproteobacteria bacterium]
MSAGKEELRRLAYLTRLELAPEEEEEMIGHLNKMLSYIEKLKELNTEGIEPTAHAVEVPAPMREDLVTNQPDTDNLLRNAPAREGDFLKVPRIIE